MPAPSASALYRRLEPAFHTQYAELRERSRAAGPLLPGTPGALVLRSGTGYPYWYRRYYSVPNREVEDFVCADGDGEAAPAMRARIDFAAWSQAQVRDLRRLGLQVADKEVSRLLVELHNAGLFGAGLMLVGTQAFMALLNELGAVAVAARTRDVDLARRQALKLALPRPFLQTIEATRLDFFPVRGLSLHASSTSVKRRGAEGLRVDVLTPGPRLGAVVAVPELSWHAQAVPHFDYLLSEAREGAVLAGGHCIPIHLPAPERFVWHKLYSSRSRLNDAAKARKDLVQAATLAAILVEQDDASFEDSARDLPAPVLAAARSRLPQLQAHLQAHPQAREQFERVLERAPVRRRLSAPAPPPSRR